MSMVETCNHCGATFFDDGQIRCPCCAQLRDPDEVTIEAAIDAAQSLEELRDALKGHGYHGKLWENLPTFGGAEPDDTAEIWSWDEQRLLAGWDLEIVPRGEWP